MKKLLSLLVVAVAASAHAVSFTWGTSKATFNGITLSSSGNTATAYLVYLGADNAFSFGDDVSGTLANITDSSVGDAQTRTTGSAAAKGTANGQYTQNGNQGYSYGVVLKYDKDGTTYYNISSDIFTVPAGTADNATGLSTSFNFSFADGGEVEKLSSSIIGDGWFSIKSPTPDVPEPATGALALAGVALLFKRRRA